MHRNADRSGLVCDCPGDCLADPPCCIGTELVPFVVIKLFHRLDQTQVSFLDQVEEEHSTANVSFCYTYHKAEVSLGKLFLCILVSLLHTLCQLNLSLRTQKRNLPDLFQIHTHRIFYTDAVRYRKVDILHIHLFLISNDDFNVYVIIISADSKHINII